VRASSFVLTSAPARARGTPAIAAIARPHRVVLTRLSASQFQLHPRCLQTRLRNARDGLERRERGDESHLLDVVVRPANRRPLDLTSGAFANFSSRFVCTVAPAASRSPRRISRQVADNWFVFETTAHRVARTVEVD
jgi:hypothetical protein